MAVKRSTPKQTTPVQRTRLNPNVAGSKVKQRKNIRKSNKRILQSVSNSLPPVLVRDTSGAISAKKPFRTARQKKAKRRYDVALNLPGAEMRLPAIGFGSVWRWVSFLLVVGLAFLIYQLWNAPMFKVEAAEVYGLQRINERTVNQVLAIAGESAFSLNEAELELALQGSFPEFANVSVDTDWPNTVVISVTERTPAITWIENGSVGLVDNAGYKFPARENIPNNTQAIVEASGPPPQPLAIELDIPAMDIRSTVLNEAEDSESEAENVEIRSETVEVSQIIGAAPFMSVEMVNAISELARHAPADTPLIYDARQGLGWRDPRGWEVYLGNTDNIDMKLRIYEAIVERLTSEGIQPVLINVVYVHAPYYRLEP